MRIAKKTRTLHFIFTLLLMTNVALAQVNVSTATFVQSKDIFTEITNPSGVEISSDGTRLFVSGVSFDGDEGIFTYNLSTAYNISTATLDNTKTLITADNDGSITPNDFAFNSDGTRLFVLGSTLDMDFNFDERVASFELSQGFDLSTASTLTTVAADDQISVTAQEDFTSGIALKPDGTAFYIIGKTGNKVIEYTMTTAFKAGTASAGSEKSVSSEVTTPESMRFNGDGTQLFVLDLNFPNASAGVIPYGLSSAYDITTASYAGAAAELAIDFSAIRPSALAFSDDGAEMYIAGTSDAGAPIWEYNLAPADVVAPTVAISSTASDPTNVSPIPITITFSEDVTGFEQTDVTVGGGSIASFSGTGASYDVTITPDNDGTLTVDIDAMIAQDAAGNDNEAAIQFSIAYDGNSPVFTTETTVDYAEGGTTSAYTAVATDFSTVTYSFGTGKDESLFSIDGGSGEVNFVSSPDFENPGDGDSNNEYEIEIIATDGLNLEASLLVTISVTNVGEDPIFTSTPVTTVNDDETYLYTVTAEDPDGDPVTIDATTLPDWMGFENYIVETFAGSGNNISEDGLGLEASFSLPEFIATDNLNTLYVIDGNKIRKIVPNGQVTTVVDFTDENRSLGSIIVDSERNLYVSISDAILKITPDGSITTFAGSETETGYIDGTGTDARFTAIGVFAMDATGDIYFTDRLSSEFKIRKVTPEGEVTTIETTFENSDQSFGLPSGSVFGQDGNLYIADFGTAQIWKVTPTGNVAPFVGSGERDIIDGVGLEAGFSSLFSMDVDGSGNLIVVDGSTIRKISPEGAVVTIAGSIEESGNEEGLGSFARFGFPFGVAIDGSNNIFVTDGTNHTVRKVSKSPEVILAGDASGQLSGDYNVTLIADDNEGGASDQSFTVSVVDVTSPDTQIFLVDENNQSISFINGPAELRIGFGFTGSRLEEVTGFELSDFSVEGGGVSNLIENVEFIGLDNVWGATITPDGSETITISIAEGAVTDLGGNFNVESTPLSITFDDIAPNVTINPLITNDPTPELSGTVDDNEATITVMVNSQTYDATNNGDGSWTLPDGTISTELLEALYDVTITAKDAAGNIGSDNTTNDLLIDTTVPSIGILAPVVVSNGSFFVLFSYSEEFIVGFEASDVLVTNGSLVGELVLFDGGGGHIAVQADGSGDVIVEIPAGAVHDLAGNTNLAVSPVTVPYDDIAPSVTVTTLVTNDQTPALSGTIDDNEATITVLVNGQIYDATNNGDNTWALANDAINTDLVEGTYNVTATATDGAGNVGTDATMDELTIDLIAPIVTIDDLITSDPTPALSGTVDDNEASITVMVNSQTYDATNNGGGSWTLADDVISEDLAEGTLDITVTATDQADNVGTDATTNELTIDLTAPLATVNTLTTSDQTPELTGNIDDTEATILVTVNDQENTATNNGDGTWTLADNTLTTLDGGSYDVKVVATDQVSNVADVTTEAALTIDLSGPTFTTSAPEKILALDENFTISLTFAESISEIDDASLAIENGSIASTAIEGTDMVNIVVTPDATLEDNDVIKLTVNAGFATDAFENTSTQTDEVSVLYDPPYSGGDGTENNPYKIANNEDLQYLSENNGEWDAYFEQTGDIVFDGSTYANGYQPIGNSSTKFTGSYDGTGHTIEGLTIEKDGAMFDYAENFEISNLTLKEINVTAVDAGAGVVRIAANGVIANVNVSGSISLSLAIGLAGTGAIVGSVNLGTLPTKLTITNCHSSTTITSSLESSAVIGGILGFGGNIEIINCSNTGNLTSGFMLGGIAGSLGQSKISGCSNSGLLYGSAVGGIVAGISGEILDSYNSGGIVLNSDEGLAFGGGITLDNLSNDTTTITRSYNVGTMTKTDDGDLVGGLVDEKTTNTIGDLIINDSFWDTESSGVSTSSGGGTGLNTAQMKSVYTYLRAGWDFSCINGSGSEGIWAPDMEGINDGYPVLAWQLTEDCMLITGYEELIPSAKVYPSITSGIITIKAPEASIIDHIEVMDIMGKAIKVVRGGMSEMQLNLSGNPAGIYLLRVHQGEIRSTHRIIIKK